MSTMLGLIGRITKSIKALSEQLRAVFRKTIKHKPVWVFFAVTMICFPCIAKTPVINDAKVTTKLVSSSKVLGKDLNQSAMQRVASKSIENGWDDFRAKGESSRSQSSAPFTPQRQPMNGDVAKQDTGNAHECDDYCGFYGWLPFILAWPLLFGAKKPQRKVGILFDAFKIRQR